MTGSSPPPTVEDYLVFSSLSYVLAAGETPSYVGWTVQAATTPGASPTFVDPTGGVWTIVQQMVNTSGVTAYAFANAASKQIIFAYRGSVTSYDWLSEDTTLGLGYRPNQDFNQAQIFASDITTNPDYDGYTFFVTGHSIGGAEAEDVAAALNIGGATFAAPGVSNLLLSDNRSTTPSSSQVLTNYILNTDGVGKYASDTVGTEPTGYHIGTNIVIPPPEQLPSLESATTIEGAAILGVSHLLTTYAVALEEIGIASYNPLAVNEFLPVVPGTLTELYPGIQNINSGTDSSGNVYQSGTLTKQTVDGTVTVTITESLSPSADWTLTLSESLAGDPANQTVAFDNYGSITSDSVILNGVTIDSPLSEPADLTFDTSGDLVAALPSSEPGYEVTVASDPDGSVSVDLGGDDSDPAHRIVDFAPNELVGDTLDIAEPSTTTIDLTTEIENGGMAEVSADAGLASVGQDFEFLGTDGLLKIDDASTFAGTVSDFDPGDTIDLAGVGTATSVTLSSNNVLTLSGTAGEIITFNLDPAQDFSGDSFLIAPAGGEGTSVSSESGANGGAEVSNVSDDQNVSFTGPNEILLVITSANLSGTVYNLQAGDTIDLAGTGAATSATISANNVLTLSGTAGGTVTANLDPTQDLSGDSFLIASDGNGGTEVSDLSEDQNVTFTGPSEILVVPDPGSFTETVYNFVAGDTIDLAGIGTATGASVGAGKVLTVETAAGAVTLGLSPAQDYSGVTFVPTTDGAGGTDITISESASPAKQSEALFAGTNLEAPGVGGELALWSTDGTAAGTFEIFDINSYGGYGLSPSNFTVLGNRVVFEGLDVNGETQLWVTDGTTGSTQQLTSVLNGGDNGYHNGLLPSDLAQFGNKILFSGAVSDAEGQPIVYQLWISDGTAAGTEQLTSQISTNIGYLQGEVGVSPSDITIVGNKAFFVGNDINGNPQLWVTDGTKNGTLPLTSTLAQDFVLLPFGSNLLFSDGITAPTLSITDGTVAGTQSLASASDTVVMNNVALFAGVSREPHAAYTIGYSGLWLTNGTAAGTQQLVPAAALVNGVSQWELYPQNITVLGNVAVFDGYDSSGQSQLWATDGTSGGTEQLTRIANRVGGLNASDFTVFDGKAVFVGTDASGNSELWGTDGTIAGTQELTTVTSFLDPQNFLVFGTKLLFQANDSAGNSNQLWVTDGTIAGTHELTSVSGNGLGFLDATVFGDKVLFSGVDANGKSQLWVTDGTVAGTHALTTTGGGATDITVVGGSALFQSGNELWTTDGTVAGTQLLVSSSEGLGPSDITTFSASVSVTACYCASTFIMTDRGEMPVEELKIGDRLITNSGKAKPIKWIGRRSYAGWVAAGNPKVMPVCFKAGSLEDQVPLRDLFVSPEHAMYVDGNLIPAGLLVNGQSIIKMEGIDVVHYFNIELDEHDVILAEGAPSETFIDDDSRGMFHNAAEYYALHPDTGPKSPPAYCAPRLEEGFALEIVREKLAARAGRLLPNGTAAEVDIQGNHDVRGRDRIAGWAHDRLAPGRRVPVVALCNGAVVARVIADRYRADLEQAGIGDGCHSFEVVLAAELAADQRHEIELRSGDDWSLLAGSPMIFESAARGSGISRPDNTTLAFLGALHGHIDVCDHTRVIGWAADGFNPNQPVPLTVIANDRVIGRVLANRLRGDLQAAGIGRGRHGFDFVIPGRLSRSETQVIRVVREADGAEVPGSPHMLPALAEYDSNLEDVLADILDRTADNVDEDKALALLTRHAEELLARRADRTSGRAEREALRVFRRRWGSDMAPEATGAEIADAELRALVIDDQVPLASRDAGSAALLSHIRALKALGYSVSFTAAADIRDYAALHRLAGEEDISICGWPDFSCVEDVLCRQAESFDIVYLHRLSTAHRYIPLVRAHMRRARIIYSVADLHYLRLTRQAQVERRPELLSMARSAERAEMFAASQSDLVFTHSPVEAAMLRRNLGSHRVHVVPFAVEPCHRPLPIFANRKGIAFVGSFSHTPNADAVFWLLHDILPRVWTQDPGLTCKIVGHGWKADCLTGLDPRVEIVGPVENLDNFFATVRLTVAPLRFGAGIKGKVLESFAAGLPCVMSEIAAEGLLLPAPLKQLVGRDADSIAERILLYHAEEGPAFGPEAQNFVAEHFVQERVNDAFSTALDGRFTVSSLAAQRGRQLGLVRQHPAH